MGGFLVSTKNLIESMKEPGKPAEWTWQRRREARRSRHMSRQLLYEHQTFGDLDKDLDDDENLWRRWSRNIDQRIWWGYDPKRGGTTHPLWHFLMSRSGQPWDDVYSELCRTYDLDNNLAGYWQIRYHVESLVDHYTDPHHPFSPDSFCVDEDGILVYTPNKQRTWKPDSKLHTFRRTGGDKKLRAWMDKRLIGKVGDQLYWFEPSWRNNGFDRRWDEDRKMWMYFRIPRVNGHRQGKPLSADEVKYFNSLPDRVQQEVLNDAPNAQAA